MSVSIGSNGSLDLRSDAGIPTSDSDQRWQPSRAGLINVWRYWDETFVFHQGRLLLLGANGSGKSLGLELLLPFLLDANASPSRLTSAAKARGGLYDRMMAGHTGNTRAGFLWVEFVCGSEYFTVGTRLRASQSTRKVDADFFTTRQRIGESLQLFNSQREPLTVKLLKEAVAEHGAVHSTAQEHRHAVRRQLFSGFSEDRYDALITALLAMRKEKLSQNLDLRKMSDTLSQALTPLEEHDLATVAEGFERLDRRRAELDALDAELKVIRRLGAHRKRYAQHVCVSVASEVRRAETERDAVTRRQREATAEHDQALGQLQATRAQVNADEAERHKTEASIEALQASDAYKSGAQLSDLQATAHKFEKVAERATQDNERHRQRLQKLERGYQQNLKAYQLQQQACTDSAQSVRAQAQIAGADTFFDVTVQDPPEPADDTQIGVGLSTEQAEKIDSLLVAWIRSRRDDISAVRKALDGVQQSTIERDRQHGYVEEQEQVLLEARRELDRALKTLANAEQQFVDDTQRWAVGCVSIGAQRVGHALPELISVAAVQECMVQLHNSISAEQAVEHSQLQRQCSELEQQIALLETEQKQLQQHSLQAPEAATWRDARDPAKGRALWSVVEPQDALQAQAIDKLEAALLAAGFLDAWIANDGQLHLPEQTADIQLCAGVSHPRSLAQWLKPSVEQQSALSAATVTSLLESIPVCDSALNSAENSDSVANNSVVIGLDGSFKLGAAHGRGRIQPASYLGASARERRRQARLLEIATERQALATQMSVLHTAQQQLQRLQQAVASEFQARPLGEFVGRAHEDLRFQERLVADSQARVERVRVQLQQAEAQLREALRKLSTLAAQHQLPADQAGLASLEDKVSQLAALCEDWTRQRLTLRATKTHRDDAQLQLTEAEQQMQYLAEQLALAMEEAAEAGAKFETLNNAVGQDYQQLLAQSNALKTQREHLRQQLADGQQLLQKLHASVGKLSSVLAQVESDRQRAEQVRSSSHERFTQLVIDRIAIDAEVAINLTGDGLVAVLNAARALSQDLPNIKIDPKTIDALKARQQEALHQARSQLGGQLDLDDHQGNHGWWILVANADGVRMSILELAALLAQQLEAGRGELAADEEALFERTLAGSIRQSLASRIRQTSQLVDQINSQLESVRTAAGGVAVKLRWHVDEQQADVVQKARQLLLKDPASLSETERLSLQDFVRARVEQARLDLEANAPWQDRLRESLDYRVWHRFSLQVAHRDWEGYKQATERLMSSLSTGERSVVLHLPMLASIAAHYTSNSGHSSCPRLILLDELFAGVDKANRAQLFGTFSAWQLDAVFTSDHEWCDYASLDGIAIHVLHPSTGDEPVTTTRFVWDGKSRCADELLAVH